MAIPLKAIVTFSFLFWRSNAFGYRLRNMLPGILAHCRKNLVVAANDCGPHGRYLERTKNAIEAAKAMTQGANLLLVILSRPPAPLAHHLPAANNPLTYTIQVLLVVLVSSVILQGSR